MEEFKDPYSDWCEDCRIYGDDYEYDTAGNLISRCPKCPFNPSREDE